MKLTYIYHSGYVIRGNDFTMIIDFYKDSGENGQPGIVSKEILSYPGRLYVLASHSHPDHFNSEILKWRKLRPDIQYIFSKDILDLGKANKTDAVYLEKSDTFQDDLVSVTALGSTDIGVSFLVEVEGKKIFHSGDLNNWHWNEESTEEESQEAEMNFLKEVDVLVQEVVSLDLVMFPLDPHLGKDYMKGAEQLLDKVHINLFAPMHFGEKYTAANAFKNIAASKGCQFISWSSKGQSIEF